MSRSCRGIDGQTLVATPGVIDSRIVGACDECMPTPVPDGHIPWEEIQPSHRDVVREVIGKASLSAQGPKESFPCRPEQYFWFLGSSSTAL